MGIQDEGHQASQKQYVNVYRAVIGATTFKEEQLFWRTTHKGATDAILKARATKPKGRSLTQYETVESYRVEVSSQGLARFLNRMVKRS